MKIGEFSRRAGVSAKALRHYEMLGLLNPAGKGADTAYRLYTDEQVAELKRILILKNAGFTLREIKGLVSAGLSTGALIYVLQKKRAEVKKQIEDLVNRKDYLHAQILALIHARSALDLQSENASPLKTYPANRHYDLIASPLPDPPVLQCYMTQWDGDAFFEELKPLEGRNFLEAGIGCGRVAEKVLKGGGSVTGVDPSARSLECASVRLCEYHSRLTLVNAKIEDFDGAGGFDAAYAVLTLCHIQYKERALANLVNSVRHGGKIVLSVELEDAAYAAAVWMDGNSRYRPEYWPNDPDAVASALQSLGCRISRTSMLLKTIPDEACAETGFPIAALIAAEKT